MTFSPSVSLSISISLSLLRCLYFQLPISAYLYSPVSTSLSLLAVTYLCLYQPVSTCSYISLSLFISFYLPVSTCSGISLSDSIHWSLTPCLCLQWHISVGLYEFTSLCLYLQWRLCLSLLVGLYSPVSTCLSLLAVASLLDCLQQLRQENMRLEENINTLSSRRDQLLAVNARLAHTPSPANPPIGPAGNPLSSLTRGLGMHSRSPRVNSMMGHDDTNSTQVSPSVCQFAHFKAM